MLFSYCTEIVVVVVAAVVVAVVVAVTAVVGVVVVEHLATSNLLLAGLKAIPFPMHPFHPLRREG